MDYQTLFETGELTPMQLRAWMDEDPVNAGRALRQRPALAEGLREILSSESTAPEVNSPVSAYDQIGDMREDLFGVDSDDMLLTRAAKGLGDAVASPLALGAAGADYLKAGFNELTGNEEGLQFEDTPDASDLIGDGINTAFAAATGGAGNILKAGAGNLVKNGLKNTLGKAKGKVLGSTTGKALLGGPKRQLAAGIGAASLFGGPEEGADEDVAGDIINTAPKTSTESISSADLDQPITDPVTGRQSTVSLDNPNTMLVNGQAVDNSGAMSNAPGLLASSNNIGNFRTIDPKDKSLEAFQRRGIQRDLNAQAGRQVREDIAKQQRINKINQRQESLDQNIREAWQNSPTNKAGVPFEQLSPADQMRMRENYMASKRAGSYNSADEATEIRNRKMLDDLDRSGGYGVNYRDPENKRNLPGQISLKDAQNRVDLAGSKPAPTQTNVFDSAETQSVKPETPQQEDEDEMSPLLKYGLPIAGTAALLHPGTRKKGAEMLKKGLNVFKQPRGPVKPNIAPGSSGGLGHPVSPRLSRADQIKSGRISLDEPQLVKPNIAPGYSGGLGHTVSPTASRNDFIRGAAENTNLAQRINKMGRPDLIKTAGSPRTVDGKRMATVEELRRQALLKSLDNI